jgi:diguanylate cyclase (GGDEF)-like protein
VLDAGLPLALDTYGRPAFRDAGSDGDAESYASALLLPLSGRGEAIGLVELCDSVERDYAAERSIAERLVKVAAGAVLLIGDRRRLEARERVADELVALGDAVARAGSLTELVRPIAESLFTAVGADDCDIWHLQGETIVCLASIDRNGFDDEMLGATYHVVDYPTYVKTMEDGVPWVIASLSDPRLASNELAALEQWGYHSNLCVPLIADGRGLGFIDIYDCRERDYAEHLDFAASIGRLLAGAFENVLLVGQLDERSRDLEVLRDVGQALTSTATFEDALGVMATRVARAIDVPIVTIYEYMEDIDSIVLRAVHERGGSTYNDDLGVPQRLSDRPGDRELLEAGLVVAESLSDPSLHFDTRESMEKWGEKSCLNVPLLFRGAPIGMMMLLETREERTFCEHDIELARAVGEQAAGAFQTGRLGRELQRQIDTDPLTGLANGRFLRGRLLQEATRARRHGMSLSLVSFEMDEFRSYALEHGRAAGNDLLAAIAAIVGGELHPQIDVAGRYGGDKFVVVLPHTTVHGDGQATEGEGGPHEGGAAALAERIRDRVANLVTDGRGERLPRRVSISAGVAEFGPDASDGDKLLEAADAAQARARRIGGNSVQTHA